MWGSAAADQPNSQNYAGIKNPAVDKLIDQVIFATDRDELVAATQGARPGAPVESLRRSRSSTADVYRTARWDRFGHPGEHPGLHARLPRHLVVGRGEGGEGARRDEPHRRAARVLKLSRRRGLSRRCCP